MRNADLKKITEYQRRMWMWMSYVTLCRYFVVRDNEGKFVVKKAGKVRLFLYYFFWINGFVKVTYLGLAYKGYLVEIHFLDQMGIVDWYLCFSIAVQAVWIWTSRRTYEILGANWTLQEQIYGKLGAPKHIENKVLSTDKSLFRMHVYANFPHFKRSKKFIVGGSALSIWIQFLSFPKYAAYFYSVIEQDTWPLRILFCTHEMIFVYHVWVHEAWSIILLEQFANNYTLITKEMTSVLDRLIDLGTRYQVNYSSPPDKNMISSMSPSKSSVRCNNDANAFSTKFISRRKLNPEAIVPGTSYSIQTLLQDYQKMMIATNSFNGWIGKIMGGTMVSNYAQFVSDVFMIFQLLKEPEVDMVGVIFYLQDASVGMWMLFRMLMMICMLYPASENFIHTLKKYITYDTPLRPYLSRYERQLSIIATKIGGYKTRGITVPQGIHCLMNWYVCAAMWQRPKDRLT